MKRKKPGTSLFSTARLAEVLRVPFKIRSISLQLLSHAAH